MVDNIHDLLLFADEESKKEINLAVLRQSVVDTPSVGEGLRPSGPIVFNIAAQADEFIPWGYNVKGRDEQLRGFWHTEPILASAVYSMTGHMAVLEWEIVGTDPNKERPVRTIRTVDAMLRSADKGNGWQKFMVKLMTDIYTQDNGGFIEIIRLKNKPDSPVVGVAHLDSFRCYRTGDPEIPVIYVDRYGREHKMRYWNIQTIEDMPSPVESMYGVQYSAVTRALRTAQIIRDIALYKKEKVSGSFARAIHLISGVTRQNIEDAMALANEQILNQNLTRYRQPVVIPTIDPTATLGHVQLDLASLPDGFDEDKTLQWYVAQLAIAFGVDYQEFAPLPGGALGSSQQSEILHLKSRGKGPAMMISNIEHLMNNTGILPANVKLQFKQEDARADSERANARFLRGKDRALRVDSGELDIEGARQVAIEDGDLSIPIADDMADRPMPVKPLENNDPFTASQVTGGSTSHNERE